MKRCSTIQLFCKLHRHYHATLYNYSTLVNYIDLRFTYINSKSEGNNFALITNKPYVESVLFVKAYMEA